MQTPEELTEDDFNALLTQPAPTAVQQANAVKPGARRAQRASMKVEALRLRKQGLSAEMIGKRLGVSESTASRIVRQAIRDLPAEEAAEVRTLELERLDMLVAGHLASAVKGNVRSAEIVLKAMDRRAKFLNLDTQVSAGLETVGNLLDRLVFGEDGEA